MIADLTGWGVRTPTANPGRAVRTGGGPPGNPMQGLVAYWKFDTSAAGTTPDATGHGNDLSLVGPTPAIQTTTFKLGGHAYGNQSFNDGLQRVENTQLVPGVSGSFSMQNWCNRSVNVGTFTLMGRCRTASGGTGDLDFRMGAYSGIQLHRVFEFAVKNAAGNLFTVRYQGTTFEEAVWYHVCCGYDAALQQIWIQVNGGQRQVLNGVSDVRLTIPNFTMVNDMDMSAAASCCAEEAGFWSKSLTDGEVVMLYNSGNARAYPFVGTVPVSRPALSYGDAWSLQVVANGGVAPSAATNAAITTFLNGIIADGLWGKVIALNCLAPDNVVACLTPQVPGPGLLLWTQTAGTAVTNANATVNGFQGTTAGAFRTGLVPSQIFTTTSGCIALYAFSNTANICTIGCDEASSARVAVVQSNVQVSLWTYADQIFTSATAVGFCLGTRVAANDERLFFAKNSTPWGQLLATKTTNGSTPPTTVDTYFMGYNQGGATIAASDSVCSFALWAKGLSSAEGQAIYNRVVTLRTALGGGLV